MPDRDVQTVRDLVYYQYAKIVARRAFAAQDGKVAKRHHYGFIKTTFRELKTGRKSWSEITREDRQLVEAEKSCIYCGAEAGLQWEHIVPKSLRIKPECATCEAILGIQNQILACAACNSAKATMGLYEFFRARHPGEPKFYDLVLPLLEKKHLKTIFNCHSCAGTLDRGDIDGNGIVTVLDIDHVLTELGPLPRRAAGGRNGGSIRRSPRRPRLTPMAFSHVQNKSTDYSRGARRCIKPRQTVHKLEGERCGKEHCRG